jgi:hypothetical protein
MSNARGKISPFGERRHYRIIARTRTHDGSLASALARRLAKPWREFGRAMHMRVGARMCMLNPTLPRIKRHELAQVSVRTDKPEAAPDGVTSKCPADAGVSNRNAAHALRDRIFLHRRHQVFVVGTLRPGTTVLETRRESSDPAQVIRIIGRQIESHSDLTIGVLRNRQAALGLAILSSRAAMLTPSPIRSPSLSSPTSPTWMPPGTRCPCRSDLSVRSTIAHWINGAVHRIDDAAEFNDAAVSLTTRP